MTAAVILLYPGALYFEIALAAQTLAAHMPLWRLTPDGRPLRSADGVAVEPDGAFDALSELRPRVVLIPGGDPDSILLPPHPALRRLAPLAEGGTLVAGICAGNLVMAAAGLLAGRRGTHNYTAEHAPPEVLAATAPFWTGLHFEHADLVRDGNLITAQPWAWRRYAAAVAQHLGLAAEDSA
jgi:putative intracellular protease/amidase